VAKPVAIQQKIWQPENNEPLQSGISSKRLEPLDERERLRIYQKKRALLQVKKEPRLHERNGGEQSNNVCLGLRRYKGIRIRQRK
jgi:hypothetical protein